MVDRKQIRAIVAQQLGVKENQVTDEAKIVDDLGADSLDEVELVMTIEEAFCIEISDAEWEPVKTVQDLVALVEAEA